MSDSGEEKMNKAERLAVASVVAPFLREGAEKARQRRVARVDKDGSVVGYTTLDEVQKALFARQKIEIEVVDGVRPKQIVCERCGKLRKVPKKGHTPKTCEACLYVNTCADCAAPVHPLANAPSRIKKRNGQMARCWDCGLAARISSRKATARPRLSCTDCGAALSYNAGNPGQMARRKDGKARCRKCQFELTKAACLEQRAKPLPFCVDCNAALSYGTNSPSATRRRGGAPPRCKPCMYKVRGKSKR